ncbi:recombination-associated protein RdgC [Reinekea marinisedimentorum]|uniref:Recombination-associated protein RdgC n=1 Tax=Reinekea marinisedimentorum TaxID=230495 RepID=A0A4R3I831_9GAMM|nr:recombination-associated protein RdgC [Reinekea marinisedimentorum]TCS41434.1 recombination associated protein RdgC [Reinekea marinisedimentorum]
MWFKNIQVYTFNEQFPHSAEFMEEKLSANTFSPLSSLQESTFGWIPCFKDSNLLVESVSGKLFISAQIQEKILPASVVNDYLNEKLDQIEQDEGRRPVKKEREQIKEGIRAELLPKAFHKTKQISAWIDPRNGWMVVNSASEKTADEFTSALREALGSLGIIPLGASAAGANILTSWYLEPETRPANTELEADLELTLLQDPTVKARYKNLDLNAPEIKLSLEAGMRICQMAMNLEDQCQFVINEKFQVKRIKYQDTLIEQAHDSEDPRGDALLMCDTLTQLISLLAEQAKPESI